MVKFYQVSGIHHHHSITVDDGVDSVSDGEDRAVREFLSKGRLDQLICFLKTCVIGI